jgi:branched-chain amino acid transport system permease protein
MQPPVGGRHLAGLAALLVLFQVLFGNNFRLNLMIVVALTSMLTISLNLIMGYAGQISLGHAAFFGLGAYATGILTVNHGISPWIALPLGMGLGAFLAFVVGVPSLRLEGHYLAMATLGVTIIVHILLVQASAITGGANGIGGIPTLSVAGFAFGSDLRFYYLVWALTLAELWLASSLVMSRFGRGLRALSTSEIAAEMCGIDVAGDKVRIFVIGGAMAAMAGSLYAHYIAFISPDSFDFVYAVKLAMIVVIGGIGSLWGSLAGATLISVLPELLRGYKDFDVLVYGLLLVAIVVLLPEGLAGGVRRLLRHGRPRRALAAPEIAPASDDEGVAVMQAPDRGAALDGSPLLRVRGISKRFGGLIAVDAVSFDVEAGRIKGIIGPNGAGKTTVFNLICGVLQPDAGEIHFHGAPIAGQPPYRIARMGLARTFQSVRIFSTMTVIENVVVGAHHRLRGGLVRGFVAEGEAARRAVFARAEALLETVGLAGRWPRGPG